jgi:hypothetical protein
MSGAEMSSGRWVAAAAAAIVGLMLLAGTWGSDASERDSGTDAARAGPDATPAGQPPALPKPRGPRRAIAVGAYIPGAPQSARPIRTYARRTGRAPAIVLYYRNWDAHQTFDEPSLRRVARNGAVPLVTWEPRYQPLTEIAAGDHDGYLVESARDARRWGRPIYVRFAHEMNGDWYPWGTSGNSERDYVRAWRHVVRVFRREGATNVRWVWTPNADSEGLERIRALYPGDRFVDWVGLSGFSWGGPWEWESAIEIFRRSYRTVTRLTRKPFMIAETAAGEDGGDKAAWIRSAFACELPAMPRVRAVVWFNGRKNWAHWDVDSSRAALRAFRSSVGAPRYSAGPDDLERLTVARRGPTE